MKGKAKSNGFVKELTRLRRALRIAAVEAFQSDVVDTEMEHLMIGPELEYSSATDWINDKIDEWLTEADSSL